MAQQSSGKQLHQKHASLTRPHMGQWGRNEFALIGAPCGQLQRLALTLVKGLADIGHIAWLDADHRHGNAPTHTILAPLTYTDRITHHELAWHGRTDSYQLRPLLQTARLVLINGNHFTAQQQVVILDPRKFDSLSRKRDRLTDIQLLISTPQAREAPDWLRPHLPKGTPVLPIEDEAAIIEYFRKVVHRRTPPLMGLVLSGGKSTRMGQDKGLLRYHGKPQRSYLFDLIAPHCQSVYYSVRAEQTSDFPKGAPLVLDTFIGLGPFGAILSAFRQNPNAAWLVVACDLPLLDQATVGALVAQRHPGKVATAFQSPSNEFPEPLIAIYEPPAYSRLLQFLAMGYACPRKMLINSDIKLLQVPRPEALHNVNTPEEMQRVMEQLSRH